MAQNQTQTVTFGNRNITFECIGAGQPSSNRPLSDELYLCLLEGRCTMDEPSLYRHIAQAYGVNICYTRDGQTTYIYVPSSARLYVVDSHARYGVARCRIPDDRRNSQVTCGNLEMRDVELAYSYVSLPNSDIKDSPFIVAPDLVYPAIMVRIGRYMPRLSPDAARPYAYAVMPPNLDDLDATIKRLKSIYGEISKDGCTDADLPVRNVPRCGNVDAPVIDEVEV